MHAGTSADDPEDAFAAVSLRFMTPHPVCEKAISAAFNSLFPMITRRIYHSEPGRGGWCLCVFGRQSVSVRGSPLSSPGDGRRVWKEIYFCAGGRRRGGIHFIYFIITDWSTAAVYVTQEENILLPPLHLYHEHGRRAVNSGILTVGVSKISV